ncbi:MAG: T9SS type A sorting domain-containing protein [Lewinellaceae bacterium]|nr:T9SS type A sorting domain-containing protein [Lewinellaceae bacterium]
MKKIVTLLIFALLGGLGSRVLNAQSGFCGTPAYKSEWLERYQQNPRVINRTMLDTLYVPMTIHIVGKDDGAGYISLNRLMDAFCQLNQNFEQAAIQFYIKGNIRYINNSNYYEHDYSSGSQMMAIHDVANTVNCYIVDSPAGNCGYYSPTQDALALSKGCLGPGDLTWAHEAGHYLSLPHTFFGWEDTQYNYNSNTPYAVTWSNITRPVEKVNGSNCSFAGDGFCDTPPDYLSGLWNCNNAGQSGQIQKDPDGVEFRSDGSLIMSYATNCQERFSDDQIGAMRANLEDERPGHIYNNQTPPAPVTSTTLTPVFPAEGEAVQNYEDFELQWEAVPGAQMYIVDISRISSFAFTVASYFTTSNSIMVNAGDLAPDKTYYWRIRPLNRYNGCTGYSDGHTFELTDLVSSTAARETVQGLRLFPNPAKENQEVALEFTSEKQGNGTVSILSLAGQILHSQPLALATGLNRSVLSTGNLPKGMYLVRIDANGGANYRKLLVQ